MKPDNLDEATLEFMRTEAHPDRDAPYVHDKVEFELKKVIGRAGDRELTVDVFTPKTTPLEPRPAIVFLHGGGWQLGSPSQFHYFSSLLASKYNFFAINVDYRLSGESPFPAALEDSKCALRWVRSQAESQNIDVDSVAICGGSAGAHLSSMILTTAAVEEYEGGGGWDEFGSHANLGILFNGEYDMWDLVNCGSLIQPMEEFIGGTHRDIPQRYDELSSIYRLHKRVPPVLLLHGTEDKCVSHKQSLTFYHRMRSLGIDAEIEIYEGKPHAWFNKEPDRTTTIKRVDKFLAKNFNLALK